VLAQLGDLAASNKEFVAFWRAKYGLDLPLWERYLISCKALPWRSRHLDRDAAPVLDDISSYAPATIELATAGFLISVIVAFRSASSPPCAATAGSIMSRDLFRCSGVVADILARLSSCLRFSTASCRSHPVPAVSMPSPSAGENHRAVSGRQHHQRRLDDVQGRVGPSRSSLDRARGGDARP